MDGYLDLQACVLIMVLRLYYIGTYLPYVLTYMDTSMRGGAHCAAPSFPGLLVTTMVTETLPTLRRPT